VPQNTIEQIEKKMIKINRRLKKEFKSKEELENKIKQDLSADANGNVSVD
jgi:NADPH-dependent 7-cyano-7-deazaguanine reductase QueF-like protein